MPVRYDPAVRWVPSDFLLAALAGAIAAVLSFYLSARLDPAIYGSAGFNVWFQADPPRVLRAMTDASSRYHYRTSVHPLFSLLTTPAMSAMLALHIPPVLAGRALMAASGFLAAGFLLLALRGLGLPRPLCTLMVAVFLVSATYVHWFCLIETYAVGAASTCFTLWVLTSARRTNWWVWWLASAASLAVTVTNWMLGLSATLFRLGLRRMVSVSIAVALTVIGLSILQRMLYPEASYFFTPSAFFNEHQYSQVHRTTGVAGWMPLTNLRSMLVSSAVAPQPQVVPGDQAGGNAEQLIVSNQHSAVSSYTLSGWIACTAWIALIVLGVAGGCRDLERRPVFLAVLAFLLGQTALNLVYGPITFLYATNTFPAMLVLAGFGWFSRFRMLSVAAAATLVLFGGISNWARFDEAVRLANSILSS